MRFTSRVCTFVAGLAIVGSTAIVQAQLPQARLYATFPMGGQAGESVDFALTNVADADDINRLIFNDPGIKAVQKTQQQNGKAVPIANQFTVTIDKSVKPGVYEVRAAGFFGMTNPRSFVVGTRPEIREKEGNNSKEQATPVEIDTVVNGQVNGAADLDFFKFQGKKGQRILVVCQAQRIDSRLRPELEVHSIRGRRLGYSPHRFNRETVVDVVLPEDGEYFVKLYDYAFAGSVDYGYRLSVQTSPYIDYVLPSSGVAGVTQRYTLYGRNLPGGIPAGVKIDGRELQKLPISLKLPKDTTTLEAIGNLTATEANTDGISYILNSPNGASNPIFIRFASAPVILEQEPNDTADKAQKITVPAEYVGQFQQRADVDFVEFQVKAKEVYWIEVYAHRDGKQIDPVLIVDQVQVDKDGKETGVKRLTLQDDVGTNLYANHFDTLTDDPAYKFTVPADGKYRVSLRDKYFESRGSPELVYRLAIRREQPDFRVAVVPYAPLQGTNNNTAATWSVGLRKGDSIGVRVMVFRRDGFNGTVDFTVPGLPEGVTCKGCSLGPGQTSAIMVFSAAENAKEWSGAVKVVANGRIEDSVKVQAVVAAEAANKAAVAALPKAVQVLQAAQEPAKKAAEAKVAADKKTAADGEIAKKAAAAKVVADKLAADTAKAAKDAKDAAKVADTKAKTDTANAKKADAAKVAAQKKATAAAAAAKKATDTKATADKALTDAQAAAKVATDKVAEAKKALDKEPNKKELADALKAAEKAAADAAANVKKATEVKTAADKAAVEAAKVAKAAEEAKVAAEKAAVTAAATAKTSAAAKIAADKKSVDTAKAATAAANAKKTTDQNATKTVATAKVSAAAAAKAKTAADQAAAKLKAAQDAKTAADKAVTDSAATIKKTTAERDAAAKKVTRIARAGTIIWNGSAQQTAVSRLSKTMGLSVMQEKSPFQLANDLFRVEVNRSRQILVPIKLLKRDGFDNNVTLAFVDQPKNVQLQVKPINKGKDNEVMRIFVPTNAPLGTYTIYLRAQGQVSYRRNLPNLERKKAAQKKADAAAKAAAALAKKTATDRDAVVKKATANANSLKQATTARDAAAKKATVAAATLKTTTAEKAKADKLATDSANAKKAADEKLKAAQKTATDAKAAAETTKQAKTAADKQYADAQAATKKAKDEKAKADAKAAEKKAAEAKAAADKAATAAANAAKTADQNLKNAQKTANAAATAAKRAADAKVAVDKKFTAATTAGKTAEAARVAAEKVFKTAEATNKASQEAKTKAEATAKDADTKSKSAAALKKAADAAAKAAEAASKAKNINIFPPSTPIVLTIKEHPATLGAAVPGGGNIKRGAKIDIKVTVKRANGFTGPVTLTLPLPPGVKGLSAQTVTVPADKNEGVLTVQAAGDATEGALANMVVRATMDFKGKAAVDQPITLKVAK